MKIILFYTETRCFGLVMEEESDFRNKFMAILKVISNMLTCHSVTRHSVTQKRQKVYFQQLIFRIKLPYHRFNASFGQDKSGKRDFYSNINSHGKNKMSNCVTP